MVTEAYLLTSDFYFYSTDFLSFLSDKHENAS